MTLPTVTVTGAVLDAAQQPAAGAVIFTPATGTFSPDGSPVITSITDPAGETVVAMSGVASRLYDAGQLTGPDGTPGLSLIPTDTAGLQPAGWQYQVTFQLLGVPAYSFGCFIPASPDPIDLSGLVPASGTADLSALNLEVARAEAAEAANATAITAETSRAETAEAGLAATIPARPVPVADGGTGAATAAEALANLGAAAASGLDAETSRAESAEALLAPSASPAFTGTPTAPTKAALTGSTAIATTAYADAAVGVETTRAEAAESANATAISAETARAEDAEALKAPLASPALTGTPTAPTAAALTDSTQLATTAYTDSAVGVEKSRAQGAESSNATAITAETSRAEAAEALLAPLASPALTGSPTAPTQTTGDTSTKIATGAFVATAVAAETTRAQAAEALALQKTGGTMSGAIAMGSHKVTGLINGSAAQDAAALGQILPQAGGTMTGWLAPAVVTLTFGAAIAVNAALGNAFNLTLTASTGTLANPVNPVDGQVIRFRITQGTGGSFTLAYGTAYDFGAAGAPVLSTAAGKTDILEFEYVASISKWCCRLRSLGF